MWRLAGNQSPHSNEFFPLLVPVYGPVRLPELSPAATRKNSQSALR